MSDFTYPPTGSPALMAQKASARPISKPAGMAAVFWCGLLFLSLSYELPLYELTLYDRLNPRLFDVVLVLTAVFSGWRLRVRDAFIGSWLLVTISFVMIGGLSFLFLLPDDYRYFSLFYAVKYIEIMVFLLVISGFDWTREQIVILLKCFAVGVALAGVWGCMQKVGVLPTERYLPNGEQINFSEGTILATYGSTYFHSGVMGAMGATVALALRMENRIGWLVFFPLLFSGLFLAIFAGSRAGIALLIFAAGLVLFRRSLYFVVGICLLAVILLLPGVLDYLSGESATIQRLLDSDHKNSVENRIAIGTFGQLGRLLDYHGAGLFVYGGGFYAVPMPDLSGLVKYRVGYGIHNIHLFPLEQAGLLGALSCFAFWFVALAKGWRARVTVLGSAGLSLLVGIFVIGWAGQVFFLGFGTENMLAAQLGVVFLLLSYTAASEQTRSAQLPIGGLRMTAAAQQTPAAQDEQAHNTPRNEPDKFASVDPNVSGAKSELLSPLSRFLDT